VFREITQSTDLKEITSLDTLKERWQEQQRAFANIEKEFTESVSVTVNLIPAACRVAIIEGPRREVTADIHQLGCTFQCVIFRRALY
jgi:hypothetical protein